MTSTNTPKFPLSLDLAHSIGCDDAHVWLAPENRCMVAAIAATLDDWRDHCNAIAVHDFNGRAALQAAWACGFDSTIAEASQLPAQDEDIMSIVLDCDTERMARNTADLAGMLESASRMSGTMQLAALELCTALAANLAADLVGGAA